MAHKLRLALCELAATSPQARRDHLHHEFDGDLVVPVTGPALQALAGLAGRHAEPEIADHLCAFTSHGPWLEWFDAPSDPISLAAELSGDAVRQFATEIGASCECIDRRQ